MRGSLQQTARVAWRFIWLAGEILLAFLDFLVHVAFQTKVPLPRARALWLQHACRRILRILDVKIQTEGPIPLQGLMACNHLSYLDILVISAITPAVFISKSEVKRWPIFGWFAQLSGTLFIRRSRRSEVARLNREVEHVLDGGGLVVLFPEGTSSDGRHVLPFKSSLLEPITRLNHPLTVGFIQYSLPEGNVAEDICYWGDMTLAPHLAKLLSKRGATSRVSFTRLEGHSHSRKELARHLHSQVLRLKRSIQEQPQGALAT